MAFKKSLISRLFNSDSDKDETEENREEYTDSFMEGTAAERWERRHTSVDRTSDPDRESGEERDPALLQLPEEHALNRLWKLRAEQTGGLPFPSLRLKGMCRGKETQPTGDGLKKELLRLQVNVTASANKRAARAFPKGEEEAAELDAEVTVFVTADKMTAWLLVYPPTGKGSELDTGMLQRALAESKVSYGVETELTDVLPEREDRYFHLFPVAQGDRPANGTDGSVIDMFPRSVQLKAAVDEFGKIDYTSLNLVQNVQEGEVICRLIQPTPGKPGTSVFGQTVTARDGKPVTAPVGRNTKLTEDGNTVVAACMGHVEFNGRGFQVNPVLEIGGNVDYSTGSINFLGDVHVHGDVCSGFDVRATGSIVVDGVVEASAVEAGGNLTLVKGVQGNGQAVIRSHRSIFAKFLENSSVYAQENLTADCLLNCEAFCDGAILTCSGRGVIIGGNVRAGKGIQARVVGSRTECHTMVSVGGRPCEDYEYEILVAEVWNLEEELERMERQPDGAARNSRLAKLRPQAEAGRARLEEMQRELNKGRDNKQERSPGKLECGMAYAGTVIRIGEAVLKLEKEERHFTARLTEGEVSLA